MILEHCMHETLPRNNIKSHDVGGGGSHDAKKVGKNFIIEIVYFYWIENSSETHASAQHNPCIYLFIFIKNGIALENFVHLSVSKGNISGGDEVGGGLKKELHYSDILEGKQLH